jgi:hypothetical protein
MWVKRRQCRPPFFLNLSESSRAVRKCRRKSSTGLAKLWQQDRMVKSAFQFVGDPKQLSEKLFRSSSSVARTAAAARP